MLQIARKLRGRMWPPEVRLWVRLRAHREGPQFRRQRPVGPYVLDFYCHAARLVIEVDGCGHSMGDRPERDERRDAWLGARGLRVVRIAASDVMADADEVADSVRRMAVSLLSCGAREVPEGRRG